MYPTRHTLLSLFAIALSAGLAARATPVNDTAGPIVDVGYSKYQGFVDPLTQNTNFLGIRYAQAPVGNLRWQEPQTPKFVSGVWQANAQPISCPQGTQGFQAASPFRTGNFTVRSTQGLEKRADAPPVSEDCLFLNVFVPGKLDPTKKLPVVVWIHGGGYVSGNAAAFDGNDLLQESGNGVVVVVLQYRLGLFGFLAGQRVKDNGALNAGLLDQQFAFQWVQDNIQLFGGDPTQVTIWGESAGAGSVIQHLVANGGATNPPLFRAAITSSSFLPTQYPYNNWIPETLLTEALQQTNCDSTEDALECLRSVDTDTLQTANADINNSGFFGTFVYNPVIDGTFITERPTELIRAGNVNGQAFLSVTESFEGAIFIDPTTADTVQVANFVAQLFPQFGPKEVNGAVAQYKGLGTNFFQVIAIYGEAVLICPTYNLLRAFPGHSFKGEFAIPPGGHANDVVYYFPDNATKPFNNTAFDTAFPETFLDFAMSLDPNVKRDPTNITPKWNTWSESGRVEMLFNKTDSDVPVIHTIKTSEALLKRCDFWNSVAAATPH